MTLRRDMPPLFAIRPQQKTSAPFSGGGSLGFSLIPLIFFLFNPFACFPRLFPAH
jgi:hypothetical protein